MSVTPSSAEAPATRGPVSRRAVLKLSLAASGLLAAGGLLEYLEYAQPDAAPTSVEVEAPPEYPAGSATHVAEAGAWLLHDAGGLYAISTRCPHLGCTVQRQPDGFTCPCHGSQFAPDGALRRGPATRGLSYLQLTLSDQGHVVVHTDKAVDPSVRLAN